MIFDFNFNLHFSMFIFCQAYTLAIKEEDGNLVVNVVADTYFGARQASTLTSYLIFGLNQLKNSYFGKHPP